MAVNYVIMRLAAYGYIPGPYAAATVVTGHPGEGAGLEPGGGPTPPDLLTGLVAWYRNDETDHSGNGNDATPFGTPEATAGIGGVAGAAVGCSNTDRFTFPDYLVANDAPWSMTGWVNRNSASDLELVYWDAEDVDAIRLSNTIQVVGGDLKFFATPDLEAGELAYQSDLPEGEWVHLAVTFDGADAVTLYVNGVEVATDTIAAGEQGEFNGTQFWLGIDVGSKSVKYQFFGVYDLELDAEQVAYLYQGGDGFDPTA